MVQSQLLELIEIIYLEFSFMGWLENVELKRPLDICVLK